MGLEYLQRRRLHNLPGQPVPGLCHPQREEVLPRVQLELPLLQFVNNKQTNKSQELQSLAGPGLATRRETGRKGFCSILGASSRSQLLRSRYTGHSVAQQHCIISCSNGQRRQRKAGPVYPAQRQRPEPPAARASLPPSLRSWAPSPCPEPAPRRAGRPGEAGTGKSSGGSLHK